MTSGGNVLTLWDGLIGASGLSILPGTSVILSGTSANGFDGSDIGLVNSTITFSLNGAALSVLDAQSILHGAPNGANETESWTQVGDFLGSSALVPEPASLTLATLVLFGLGLRILYLLLLRPLRVSRGS